MLSGRDARPFSARHIPPLLKSLTAASEEEVLKSGEEVQYIIFARQNPVLQPALVSQPLGLAASWEPLFSADGSNIPPAFCPLFRVMR
jgi:hypothetical protein